MSENNHTPEPFAVGDEKMCVGELMLSSNCHPIYDNDGLLVGITFDTKDARRIVACVNACAGIPTERLDSIKFPLMKHLFGYEEHAAKLVKQRDELAETINAIAALCTYRHESKEDFIGRVRAALGDDPELRISEVHRQRDELLAALSDALPYVIASEAAIGTQHYERFKALIEYSKGGAA